MDPRGFQQYKQQAINTMTQSELLDLLYSEATKRLTIAELSLGRKEYERFEEAMDRAIAIVNYLDDTLDRQYEISVQLNRLYDYFTYELGRAKIGRDLGPLQNVRSMLKELQGTFKEAQDQLSAGKQA